MTTTEQPAVGWWLASDGNWYPPELAPSVTEAPTTETDRPAIDVDEWMVREDGRNGRVRIHPKAIVRTMRRAFGKDDVLTIPLGSISGVYHDRRTLGSDVVKVAAGVNSYEWKIKDGQRFVERLNGLLYA